MSSMPSKNMHYSTSMALPFILLLTFLLLSPSLSFRTPEQLLLDQITLNSTFHSPPKHHKTAVPYKIRLPSNLSNTITAEFVRFRTGSLRRHGAKFMEFTLPPAIFIHPHIKRIILVHQNLGNVSSFYYNLSGYRLVSPVLGLLMYPTELEISVREENPITIDFSRLVRDHGDYKGQCVGFELDGRVRIYTNESTGRRHVCYSWGKGHYGIVVREEGQKHRWCTWKVVAAGVVGGGFGVVMLGLVVVAVASERRRKGRAAEERRAYEDEALRVSMVGHVQAPVAGVARTAPAVENDYGFKL